MMDASLRFIRYRIPSEFCIMSAVKERYMATSGQFRFTPPTHALLAFRQALAEWRGEGGLGGRAERYRRNCAALKAGMAELGFTELVPAHCAGYIITCFHYPHHHNFSFETFYHKLSDIGR